jgi:hypothetical protein
MGGYGYGTVAVYSCFFLWRLYSAAPTSKRRITTRGTRIAARSVVWLALVEEEPERAPAEPEDRREVVEGELREEKPSALLVARLPAAGKLPVGNAGTELLFFEEELCPVCEAAPAAPR